MNDSIVRRRRAAQAAAFLLLPLILLSGCATVAYQPPPQPGIGGASVLTPPAALRKVRDGLGNAGTGVSSGCRYAYKDYRATFTEISYTKIDICENSRYEQAPMHGAFRYRDVQNMTITHWSGTPRGYRTNISPWIYWMDHKFESARGFADGINALRYYASGSDLADDGPKFARFQEEASGWRALPVKPPLPEQVRRFRLLAEDALKSKDFEGAVDYYEQGLQLLPLWPEGQFNAALVYGELGIYGQAVIRMKRYLELRPDAPDAQAARDQIVIWQAKR